MKVEAQAVQGSAFWRNVGTVLGSTAIAQVIPLAVLPVLTRLIGAEDIGAYFIWLGVSLVITVVATARLDVAIYAAETEEAVYDLLRLICLIAVVISMIGFLFLAVLMPLLENGLSVRLISDYSVAVVFFAFLMALNQSLLAVLVWRGNFKKLGAFKVILAAMIALMQLSVAFMGLGLPGLIYAQLFATFVVTLFVAANTGFWWGQISRGWKVSRLKKALRKNYRFPLFSMPADFINSFSAQMPVFLMGSRFGATPVAFYALTLKVLSGPVGLLAGSVLTVFKEQAARDFREKGNCRESYLRTFKVLSFLGIFPFLFIALFGETLFAFAFGSSWSEAGVYAQILSPMFYLKFVASPLSYTLYISNRQSQDLLWQMLLLLMTWAAFSIGHNIKIAIATYSAGYSLLYMGYLLMSYSAARGRAA